MRHYRGAFQFLSGWLRGTKGGPDDPRGEIRGDHYDMTPHRRIFERGHKMNGYFALALAVLAILTGLWQANAPHWIWIGFVGWSAGLVVLFFVLWARLKTHTTYAAIWGPDPKHPGNR